MSFTRKIVGNLEFNQEEGEIKHTKTGEILAKFSVKLAVPIHLWASLVDIPIDSAGIKYRTGHIKLSAELLKHLRKAYFQAYLDDPTATDAVVRVELYDLTAGEVVSYLEYAGEGGFKTAEVSADDLKARAEHILFSRINITTASSTSGATQSYRSAILVLIYDFT